MPRGEITEYLTLSSQIDEQLRPQNRTRLLVGSILTRYYFFSVFLHFQMKRVAFTHGDAQLGRV